MATINECNHIITLGYLKNLIGNDLWDSDGKVVRIKYNGKDDTYCPTYGNLYTNHIYLPLYGDFKTDGISISGTYTSTQLMMQKDITFTYTRYSDFSISASDDTVEASGSVVTLSYDFTVNKHTNTMNTSCSTSETTSIYSTANTVTYSTNIGTISGDKLTIPENAGTPSSDRDIIVTGTTVYKGETYTATTTITQQGLGGSYKKLINSVDNAVRVTISATTDSGFTCSGGICAVSGTGYYTTTETYMYVDDYGREYPDMTTAITSSEKASTDSLSKSYTFIDKKCPDYTDCSETKELKLTWSGLTSSAVTFKQIGTHECEDCTSYYEYSSVSVDATASACSQTLSISTSIPYTYHSKSWNDGVCIDSTSTGTSAYTFSVELETNESSELRYISGTYGDYISYTIAQDGMTGSYSKFVSSVDNPTRITITASTPTSFDCNGGTCSVIGTGYYTTTTTYMYVDVCGRQYPDMTTAITSSEKASTDSLTNSYTFENKICPQEDCSETKELTLTWSGLTSSAVTFKQIGTNVCECSDYIDYGYTSVTTSVTSSCVSSVTITANVPYTAYTASWVGGECQHTPSAPSTSAVSFTVNIGVNSTQEVRTITRTENHVTYEITQPAGPCGGCTGAITTYKYADATIGCESAATKTVTSIYTATTTYDNCAATTATGSTNFTLTNITCNGGNPRTVSGYENNVESTVFANAHPKITQSGGCSCCPNYNEFGTASTAVTVSSPCAQDVIITANVPYTSHTGSWGTDGCVYTTAATTSSVTITVHVEDNNMQQSVTTTGTLNHINYTITQPAGPCGGCTGAITTYKYADATIGCESAATTTVTAIYTATTTYDNCATTTATGSTDFTLTNITCNGGNPRTVSGYESNVESTVFANAHPKITQNGGCSCCNSYNEFGTASTAVTVSSPCAQDVIITANVPYTSHTGTWVDDGCTDVTAATTSSVTISVHVEDNNTQQSVTTTGTLNNINYTITQPAGPCGGCHAISTTYKYADVGIGCESAATTTVTATYTATTTYTDCAATTATGNTDFTLTNIACNGGNPRTVSGYESNVESTVFANAHPKITQSGGCSCCNSYNEFGTASTAVTVSSPCAQDVTITANVPYTSHTGTWVDDGCTDVTAATTSSVTISVHVEDNNTQQSVTTTGTLNNINYTITQPAGPCGGCTGARTTYKYADATIGCESAATTTVTATYTATTTYDNCATTTATGSTDFTLTNIACNDDKPRTVSGYESNVESTVFANAHPKITQSGGCTCLNCKCEDMPMPSDVEMSSGGTNGVEAPIGAFGQVDENCFTLGTPTSSEGFVHDLRLVNIGAGSPLYIYGIVDTNNSTSDRTATITIPFTLKDGTTCTSRTFTLTQKCYICDCDDLNITP